uniref:Uncharacterized protein n=1 Tax=Sarcophilus harrisii TaxID=9305 RepID=A0A7N4V7J3_SARHA
MAVTRFLVPSVGVTGEGTGIPKNIREWLQSAYCFATKRNDFWRNLTVNLGFFAADVRLTQNLSDTDLMSGQ